MSITQSRLAKAIGVDARRINSIVRGERAVTAETALLLASFFGNSPLFWMGYRANTILRPPEIACPNGLARSRNKTRIRLRALSTASPGRTKSVCKKPYPVAWCPTLEPVVERLVAAVDSVN